MIGERNNFFQNHLEENIKTHLSLNEISDEILSVINITYKK